LLAKPAFFYHDHYYYYYHHYYCFYSVFSQIKRQPLCTGGQDTEQQPALLLL